ncbi:unnamed protein product [Cylicocyclus nassatus]|uniref:C-type lectin domain-containing protein n=1 Tax=Cylicocyclus nassatus TaxID=53992 RepID=A0AA36M8F5_CYLNA|nr:unnamed protein product [Cylicocyclus nassatus]
MAAMRHVNQLISIAFVFLASYCNAVKNETCHCDSNERQFQGYTYKRSCNATFDEAEAKCRLMGGHLASIHSEEENSAVYRMSESYQNYTTYSDFTWIGLKRSGTTWKWTDGTPLDFTKWSAKEPNNYMNLDENCVEMYTGQLSTWQPNTGDYEWNDVNCEKKMLFFVCKYKKGNKDKKM